MKFRFKKIINFHPEKQVLFKIYKYISLKRKRQLLLFLVTSLISGLAESLSIASVIPFLTIISNPDKIFNVEFIRTNSEIFGITKGSELIGPFIVIFCFTVLLSGLIRIINLKLSNRISALIGSDLNYECLKRTINQPFQIHIERNTSEIIGTLIEHINVSIISLNSLLQLLTSLIISILLILTICLINFQIAATIFLIISIFYIFIFKIINSRLRRNSFYNAKVTEDLVKIIQESLGAYRDVLLNNLQDFFLYLFKEKDKRKRLYLGDNNYLQAFPKFTLESIGLILIAIVSYIFITRNPTQEDFIPILGSFALAAQKLLPSAQQVYLNWVTVKSCEFNVEEVLKLLNQQINPKSNNLIQFRNIFRESIKLQNTKFCYGNSSKVVLKDINLKINKGEMVGIIGQTGSGKSTLIDIIMGLLKPSSGSLLIDDKNLFLDENKDLLNNWSRIISHVPQNIYLADASIEKNIAFGQEEQLIDKQLVKKCAEKARLKKFIDTLPKEFKTYVGENGIKLSGGQKQRIGIARAIYKKSEILILDEATSALDNNTEKKIMRYLNKEDSNLTIIMIAHRLSTLSSCDKIIEIESGEIKSILKPEDIT